MAKNGKKWQKMAKNGKKWQKMAHRLLPPPPTYTQRVYVVL
jgi:hypothetical protein